LRINEAFVRLFNCPKGQLAIYFDARRWQGQWRFLCAPGYLSPFRADLQAVKVLAEEEHTHIMVSSAWRIMAQQVQTT
jgi:hypothetical protein